MKTYPVGLGGTPLDLVDFPLCSSVSQNWVLNRPRHLLDVPDQSLQERLWELRQQQVTSHLMIVASRAYMTGWVWGPGDAIDTGAVVV